MAENNNPFLQTETKDIFPKREEYPEGGGVNVFSWLTQAGTIIAPWYSKKRDKQLRKFWKGNDHLSGAMYAMVARMSSIPVRVEARDKSIVSHIQQAAEFNKILLKDSISRSDPTQKGWTHVWSMFLTDHYSQDNGAALLIDGPGRADGPLTGKPTRLIHVDSFQVTRKANPEFPITYTDRNGKIYKIHHSRVIAMASMASPAQNMYGVGTCAVSRCINYAQILLDMLVYKQEKLGSRPKERLIIGKKGVTAEDIAKAFMTIDEHANAQGLTRYGKTAVLAPNERSSASEIDIEVTDLVDATDVFDEQISTTLGLYTIALAFGIPARWIWPATVSGATKADAQLSHIAGTVQGPGEILRNLLTLLDDKFLPPQLMMTADYQDDEQDRQQAEIRKTRAEQRKTDLEDQVYTLRTAREQALSSGDITQEQFNSMELEDGRLPSGDPAITALNIKDIQMEALFVPVFDASTGNPLDIDANDPIDMIIAIDEAALVATDATQNAPSARQKRKARIVLAALGELKTIYEQSATDEASEEVVAEFNLQSQGEPEEDTPEQAVGEIPQENEQEIPEEAQKAFNFSARAGEVIGGGLARDPEGKFISAAQMEAAIRARLLEKIRGRKLEGKTDEENRLAVLQELADNPNFPVGGLDALVTLGAGGIPDDGDVTDALVEQGLAKVNPDGSVQISAQGASLLIAANSGNARRAQEALIRAQVAKKPEKPARSGAAAKPKEKTEAQVQSENRAKIAEILADEDLTADAIEAFNEFFEGADLENIELFAQFGFVEVDSRGNARITKEGTDFIKASNDGDVRNARDIVSVARDRMLEPEEDSDQDEKSLIERVKALFGVKDGLSDYRLGVRAAVRSLWQGRVERVDFVDNMVSTITRGLRRAWMEGARKAGIAENELTEAEVQARADFINGQFVYLPQFATAIDDNSRGKGGKLTPLFKRGETWVNRYNEAFQQSFMMASGNKKLEWFYDPQKENCVDCANYNGRVYRASIWAKHNIHPRMWHLECRGQFCGCRFEETNKAATPGRPPIPTNA